MKENVREKKIANSIDKVFYSWIRDLCLILYLYKKLFCILA